MPIRDILVTAVVFGALPVILFNPWIGILAWTWLGLMNPHRLSWGFAHDFPFAQLVAIATLAGMALKLKHLTFRWEAPAKVLALFIGWMAITTVFAMYPESAIDQGIKNAKIMVMVFATMILIDDQRKLNALVWVTVLSLSYFGVKGGIYTILGGGSGHVLGPEGSFISGNTEAGLAMTMLLPLQRYLQLQSKTQWMRYALLLSLVLTSVAAIGTQSRGALVAMLAIGVFLWAKSRQKAGLFILIMLVAGGIVALMPDSWFQKMTTILDYEADGSAMGRIGAWRLAIAIAANNFFGGGFACFTHENYARYMGEFLISSTGNVADAHSIYFQVLAHHGFVGLAIFLVLLIVTWRSLGRVIAATRDNPALLWMSDLASMLQVSLIGFMVAGAFLGLAYFDFAYAIMAMACILTTLQERAAKATAARAEWPGRSSSDALAEQRVTGQTARI